MPTSLNYRPFGVDGTRIRSVDKQIERDLLLSAFLGIESGNFNDQSIQSRVIQDGSVSLDKLDSVVKGLLGGRYTTDVLTINTNGQVQFTLSFSPPTPTDTLLIVNTLIQPYGITKAFTITDNSWTYP
jgi:hypothetical protein